MKRTAGSDRDRDPDEGEAGSISAQIDARIAAIGDWRGPWLARFRAWIKEADPGVLEELKWRKPSNPAGVPTWSHDGIVCTGDTFKGKVKITFGSSMPASKAMPCGPSTSTKASTSTSRRSRTFFAPPWR